ncbi:MAG: 3'(2'),5'-bisphosphate nucleotidase CysQ [Neptuniibacter sp.]
MEDKNTLIDGLLNICERAAEAIMEVYKSPDIQVSEKADSSPVTQADLAAHKIIQQGLSRLTPDIPQLSEEDTAIDFPQRQQWSSFWCIDPLDGTKEFIHRNDEFTINIALIENHRPTLGIIYVPATGTAYWGGKQLGAWKKRKDQNPVHIRSRPLGEQLIVAASRRHGQDKNDRLLKPILHHFEQVHSEGVGSSLKMCLIAEGLADFYPRLFPTNEWDTAAAQAIIEAAGGKLVNAGNLEPLTYNKKESLENPYFFVCGDPQFPLEEIARRA